MRHCGKIHLSTWQNLRSANHQLLALSRFRLNTYGHRAFSVAGPPGLELSVQSPSDVYLKCICSLDTSSFSMLRDSGW